MSNLVQIQKQALQLIVDNWDIIQEKGLYISLFKCRDSSALNFSGDLTALFYEIQTAKDLRMELSKLKSDLENLIKWIGINHECRNY